MMRPLVLSFILIFLAACNQAQDSTLSDRQQKDAATAEKFEQSGNLAAAAAVWRVMITQPEPPATAYIKLAGLYRKLGQPKDAVTVMRAAEARSPGNIQVLSQLAYALIDARQPEKAVDIFDKLIAVDPNDAMHLSGKAVAFDHAGNHVAAQEIYQQALALAPDSSAIRNNLAMSMILNGQYDEAVALLEELAARADATPTVRSNLALAYGLQGDTDKAMAVGGQRLTPKQAQDNLKFYEEYGRLRENARRE